MSEHYPRGTESVTKWCERCNRETQHAVSAGRLGRCMEHESQHLTKQQQRREREKEKKQQGDLF